MALLLWSKRSLIRKRLISLGTMALVLASPCALAQDQARERHLPAVGVDERRFALENALALSKMSLAMSVESTGDVDRDFVALMLPHHQGAIDFARAELKYGHNEELRRLAQNIIAERKHEISLMQGAAGEPSPCQMSDESASTNPEHPSRGRHQQE